MSSSSSVAFAGARPYGRSMIIALEGRQPEGATHGLVHPGTVGAHPDRAVRAVQADVAGGHVEDHDVALAPCPGPAVPGAASDT